MEQYLSNICKINLNKPTYNGTSMLDLSKVLMQNFHYSYTQKKCGDNVANRY